MAAEMSVTDFMRKKRALVVRWALRSQDENARRLDEGKTLDTATGKDGKKMAPNAKLTVAIKAMEKLLLKVGHSSGELRKALQNRKYYKVSHSCTKVDCDVFVPDELKQRLAWFETERIWSPTKAEAWHLTLKAFESGLVKGYSTSSQMKRPARPFFGRSAKVDKLLVKEYRELVEKYMTDSLRKRLAESNKKAKLKLKIK